MLQHLFSNPYAHSSICKLFTKICNITGMLESLVGHSITTVGRHQSAWLVDEVHYIGFGR